MFVDWIWLVTLMALIAGGFFSLALYDIFNKKEGYWFLGFLLGIVTLCIAWMQQNQVRADNELETQLKTCDTNNWDIYSWNELSFKYKTADNGDHDGAVAEHDGTYYFTFLDHNKVCKGNEN